MWVGKRLGVGAVVWNAVPLVRLGDEGERGVD